MATIRLVQEEGLFCPEAFCAYCLAPIENVKDGIVVWEMNGAKLVTGTAFFLHRGNCDHKFCDGRGGRLRWWWMPLRSFMIYIAHNIRWRPTGIKGDPVMTLLSRET